MMLAVDTNILVRLFINDEKKQAQIAASLFEKNHVFISKTVLLESEWVLRACYTITSAHIAQAFEGLLGVPNITVEDANNVTQVIMLYKKGMDFGDAMHLTSSQSAKRFVSFDKKLIKKATQVGIKDVFLAE